MNQPSFRIADARPRTESRASRTRRLCAVVAIGSLFIGIAACADESQTPESTSSPDQATDATSASDLLGSEDVATGEPIKVGLLSEGTSDTVDASDEITAGEATAEFLNQHRGGLAGRPIELVTCEMKVNPSLATECATKMITEKVVAVAVPQSAYGQEIWEPLHDAGIPMILLLGSGAEIEADDQSTFLMTNPTAAFFGLPIALAESVGASKVAFVIIDVPQALEVLDADDGATMSRAGLDYDVVPIPLGTPDMVPQMERVKASGAGVVHILGNDAFCIAAIQGLKAVGYTGAISGVSPCFTDATRAALGSDLEGVSVLSPLATGAVGDPTYDLYSAVMETYGSDVKDVPGFYPLVGYSAVATIGAALDDFQGEVTPETVNEAFKTMDETELPAGGGVVLKCGGTAVPAKPAICTNQWLRGVLDAEGKPGAYTLEDSSDVLG